MASAVARREQAVEAAVAPHGIAAATAAPAQREWQMLDVSMATLLDEGLRIGADEYAALARTPVVEAAPSHEADAEFTAILKMKREPLVLDDAEATVYAGLRQRRASRVGKPLPIE